MAAALVATQAITAVLRSQLNGQRLTAYAGAVGSSGAKRRKQRHPLPKVGGPSNIESTEQPSPLTPAGVVQAHGTMFQATRSSDRRQRRAGLAVASAYLLPLFVLAIMGVVGVVHFAFQ
jgi:hypothetical protein